jgi:hypothetical protein
LIFTKDTSWQPVLSMSNSSDVNLQCRFRLVQNILKLRLYRSIRIVRPLIYRCLLGSGLVVMWNSTISCFIFLSDPSKIICGNAIISHSSTSSFRTVIDLYKHKSKTKISLYKQITQGLLSQMFEKPLYKFDYCYYIMLSDGFVNYLLFKLLLSY